MKNFLFLIIGLCGAFTTVLSNPSSDEATDPEVSPTPLPLYPTSMQEDAEAALHTDISKLIASPSPAPESATPNNTKLSSPSGEDKQPTLRAKTLELAGAFSNDGYKIRDGFWLSEFLPIGQTTLLAVNLFAGNQYWFCIATTPPAKRIALKLYNENGQPVATHPYEDHGNHLIAALGAEPSHSGKHYLSIELIEGSHAPFCVLYTYK